MEVQIPPKTDYVRYFELSESVLQELLPKLTEEQIVSLVSNVNWVAFPLPGEESRDEIENRPDPHIDLRLLESTVRIGLRCNTVNSVDKLQNILQEYHLPEKDALIASMLKLDDDFQTMVYAKIKEHNWSERAEYRVRFAERTNKLDKAGFDKMFQRSSEIREEGKRRMREEHLPHNPVTPVIEIAFTTIARGNDQLFLDKLSQLKPIYATSLKVKTASSIRAELRASNSKKSRMSSRTAIFNCPKCGKEFTKEDAKLRRFCDVEGMKIQTTFVYN